MRFSKATLLACASWLWIVCAHGAQFADPREDVDELMSLVQERLALMEDVARWKYAHSVAVRDPAREAVVLDSVQKQASELGLESATVGEFFRVQIDAASALEERHIERFKAGKPVGDVRDLAHELRPRLDALGKEIFASLYRLAADMPQAPQRSSLKLAMQFERAGFPLKDSAELERTVLHLRLTHPPSFAALKRSGVLRIATTADYAPFSEIHDAALTGTDIDLAAKFAESLGLKPHFIRTTWPTLMSDFNRNAFDLAVGGISVTPERSTVAKFTVAYRRGGKTPIVRCGTESAFDTLAEIDQPSVRVIVNPGGTNEQFAKDHLQHAHLRVFPDNTKIFQEIAAGRADVMVTDDAEADLQTSLDPTLCRATPQTFTRSDKAWMLSDNPELLKAANDWLARNAVQ